MTCSGQRSRDSQQQFGATGELDVLLVSFLSSTSVPPPPYPVEFSSYQDCY